MFSKCKERRVAKREAELLEIEEVRELKELIRVLASRVDETDPPNLS